MELTFGSLSVEETVFLTLPDFFTCTTVTFRISASLLVLVYTTKASREAIKAPTTILFFIKSSLFLALNSFRKDGAYA